MHRPLSTCTLITLVALACFGCDNADEDPTERAQNADVATAMALWAEAEDYRNWAAHTSEPVPGQEPHGAYIQTFYNDTAQSVLGGEGPWPDGTIFVKDNYPPNDAADGPGDLAAVTMMKKTGELWFWAKFAPDGSLAETPEGTPVAGTEDLGCIGCHEALAARDHVVTDLGN